MSAARIKQWQIEIAWLENEIEKLELVLGNKPSVQKQIKTYKNQIRQKEFEIMLRSE